MRFDFPTIADTVRELPPWQRWLAASLSYALAKDGVVRVSVASLAADLNVSADAIEKALNLFVKLGLMFRDHTGAMRKTRPYNVKDHEAARQQRAEAARKGKAAQLAAAKATAISPVPANISPESSNISPQQPPLPPVPPPPPPAPSFPSPFIPPPLESSRPAFSEFAKLALPLRTPPPRLLELFAKEYKCATGKDYSVTDGDFGRLAGLAARVGETDVSLAITNLFARFRSDPFWCDKPPTLDQLTKGLNPLRAWSPPAARSKPGAAVRHLHVDESDFTEANAGKVKF